VVAGVEFESDVIKIIYLLLLLLLLLDDRLCGLVVRVPGYSS
jgi:hypothetical protein